MNFRKVPPLEHEITMLYVGRVLYGDRITLEEFIQEIHARVDKWGDKNNDDDSNTS